MNNREFDLPACFLPVLLFIGGSACNLAAHAQLMFTPLTASFSWTAITVLSVLVLGGMRYYRTRPMIGLLTSISILGILASWYDVIGPVDMALVILSGIVGAGGCIYFLALSIRWMAKNEPNKSE